MDKLLDEFIISCESNIICFAEDLGLDLNLDETAIEGVNMDIAKLVRAEDVKEAKQLVKDAKKDKKAKEFNSAIKKLTVAKALINKMKTKVDGMPEPDSRGQKILSYFTPIFTMMPTDKLEDIKVIPVFSSSGDISFIYEFTYVKITDKMSKETKSSVKKNLQYKFNLFIHNVDKTIDSYKEAKRYYEAKMKKKAEKNKS